MTTMTMIKKQRRGRPKLPAKLKKPRKRYYQKKSKDIPHGNVGRLNPNAGRRFDSSSVHNAQQIGFKSVYTIDFIKEAQKKGITQRELFNRIWQNYKMKNFLDR